MLKKLFLLFFPLVFLLPSANAQYVQIGDGAFANGNFGPLTTDTLPAFYSRFAHIYPAASLGDLVHGDSLSALVFKHRAFDSLRGSCSVKIYLKSTSQADFGTPALNWLAESRNGMTLVFQGDIKDIVGDKPGDAVFVFNQIGKFGWDTTGMAINLEVLIEYTQSTNQVERMNWYVENSFTVPAFFSANESKFIFGSSTSGLDSITTSSSVIKPTLRIYISENTDELELDKLYALGTVPTLMNRADSIKALLTNVGSDTVFNRKVYLEVSGVNSFTDSTVISSIAPYQKAFVYFTNYQPTNLGTESIKVTLGADSVLTNNELTKNRTVSYNVFSHSDPFAGSSGGVGFNGSTGDFVAKFYVDGIKYLNQIKVDFNLGGRSFQLAMWDDNGTDGLPGTELFVSDTAISVAGTFIMPVLPRVQVSGGFYIGIRQTSGNNVAFSFQEESPIRPSTFFFASPAQDTNWVAFSPGFDFNFNVQPRLQVANDLAILNIISPFANQAIKYSTSDSIDIAASIINFGYQNQASFLVNMDIKNRFNQVVASFSKVVSLPSDDTLLINFGKFSRFNLGKFTAEASVDLNTDSVQDNNTKSVDFFLIKDHDVAVDRVFSPRNNDTFELNREGFAPTVRVINYGEITQNNFKVVGELLNASGDVLNYQETFVSLAKNLSTIHSFDTMFLTQEGCFTYRAYTLLDRDSFPINDTSFVRVCSKKIDDIMMLSISKPKDNFKYAKGITLEPFITYRNDGRTNQDSTYFYVSVSGEAGDIIYRDTALQATTFFTTGQAIFKDLVLDSLKDYIFQAIAYIPDDQVRANDTLRTQYSVVTGNDIKLVSVIEPGNTKRVGTASTNPKVVVRNNGANALVAAPISMSIEDNTGAMIYTDSLLLDLGSFTSDTFDFKLLSYDILGDYYVEVVNDWSSEDEPSENDTLNATYIVRYSKDISLIKHLAPIANDTVEIDEEVSPSIQLVNLGVDTIQEVEVLVEIENANSTIVFRDTLKTANLPSNSAVSLVSDLVFATQTKGVYSMTSRVMSADNNTDNNILTTNFIVLLRKDAAIVSSNLPTDNQKLYYKTTYKPEVKVKNNGSEEITNTDVSCIVTLKDGDVIFNQTKTVTMPANSELVVSFDSTLTHDKLDSALARFAIQSPQDQIKSNNDLFVDFQFVIGLGVSDFSSLQAEVYPNPFTTQLRIKAIQPVIAIRVIDLAGKVVYVEEVAKIMELDISPILASGQYILELVYAKGSDRFPIIKSDN